MVENQTDQLNDGGIMPQNTETETTLHDAPAPAELAYISKEQHFTNNVLILEAKIEVHKKLNFALEIKIGRFAEKYGETEWADIPVKDLFKWAKLQNRHYDNDATLTACEFELLQIVSNLKRHVKQLEIYEKEMETNWEPCIEKLKAQADAKRKKGDKNTLEMNTIIRANEVFDDREQRIEFYREMLAALGIK